MRESSLRKEKWSPQIASDGTRLQASLPTQRFDPQIPRGLVSGVIYEWLSEDSSPRPRLASFLRLVLSKVMRQPPG